MWLGGEGDDGGGDGDARKGRPAGWVGSDGWAMAAGVRRRLACGVVAELAAEAWYVIEFGAGAVDAEDLERNGCDGGAGVWWCSPFSRRPLLAASGASAGVGGARVWEPAV